MSNLVNRIVKQINSLPKILEKPLVMGTLSIFIVLYGALAKPELPNLIKNLMQNDVFRLFFIFLIAYIGDKNFVVSIVVAFTYIVTFGLLTEVELQESFKNTHVSTVLEEKIHTLLDELELDDDKPLGTSKEDTQE